MHWGVPGAELNKEFDDEKGDEVDQTRKANEFGDKLGEIVKL